MAHLFKQCLLGGGNIGCLPAPDFQRWLLQGPAEGKREGPRQPPAALVHGRQVARGLLR